MTQRYFLADAATTETIRHWLTEDGKLAPYPQSAPRYFDTAYAAYSHPMAEDLYIHACQLDEIS
jgi:hypothetical protein